MSNRIDELPSAEKAEIVYPELRFYQLDTQGRMPDLVAIFLPESNKIITSLKDSDAEFAIRHMIETNPACETTWKRAFVNHSGKLNEELSEDDMSTLEDIGYLVYARPCENRGKGRRLILELYKVDKIILLMLKLGSSEGLFKILEQKIADILLAIKDELTLSEHDLHRLERAKMLIEKLESLVNFLTRNYIGWKKIIGEEKLMNDSLIDSMISHFGHEFRNTLTPIKLAIDLIGRYSPAKDLKKASIIKGNRRSTIDLIDELTSGESSTITHLLGEYRDMLVLMSSSNDKTKQLSYIFHDQLTAAAKEAKETVRNREYSPRAISQSDLRDKFEILGDDSIKGVSALIPSGLVRLLVTEFISNTVKYAVGADEYHISFGTMTENNQEYLTITSFHNSPVPIPTDIMDKIFDRNVTTAADSTTGTGNGLANIRSFLYSIGGDITVTSIQGETIFVARALCKRDVEA